MQRITNCILIDNNKVLLLQKPSKGWWVAPGGKMESGESIAEAAKREYYEETGLMIDNLELVSIFTIIIEEDGEVVNEWMMFSFKASKYEGTLFKTSPEGKLAWIDLGEISALPMAEGDKFIFDNVAKQKPIFGTLYYTQDWKLTKYRME